jgi:hypothetical protein
LLTVKDEKYYIQPREWKKIIFIKSKKWFASIKSSKL